MFDVPTAVSRPIQRCLKYPLFIGELIKVFFVKIRVFFFAVSFKTRCLVSRINTMVFTIPE